MAELRITLRGEDAELGRVPAGDVARLILSVERAVARTASVVIGRPKVSTGRNEAVIAQAARFRLRAVEAGSVVPVLELPEAVQVDDLTLNMAEVATLSETAVRELLSAMDDDHPHPLVAAAALEVADACRLGDRYEAVDFRLKRPGSPDRHAKLDRTQRDRLRAYVEGMPQTVLRDDVVAGTLVEADFEKRTARLRSIGSEPVVVSFTEAMDDAIQEALRKVATFQGRITYDPETLAAKAVLLEAISRGRQLTIGGDAEAFWRTPTLGELADEQGTGTPLDPADIYDADATDAEANAFMRALAETVGE
jgi:hypothetical protein